MSLKTLIATTFLFFAVISSNPAQAYTPPTKEELDALMLEAEKWGVECDTSTPIKINTCKKRISNAKLKDDTQKTKQDTLERVRDLQDFVNQEGKYKK